MLKESLRSIFISFHSKKLQPSACIKICERFPKKFCDFYSFLPYLSPYICIIKSIVQIYFFKHFFGANPTVALKHYLANFINTSVSLELGIRLRVQPA